MSLKENKAVACRLVEQVWSKEDLDALAEIMSADCILHGFEENGLEPYGRSVTNVHTSFPDWQFTIEDAIAEGDKVVVRWNATGTNKGEWFGVPPTNKEMNWLGWTTVRIAEGKITEVWQLWSILWFFSQLGVSQPMKELVKLAKASQE